MTALEELREGRVGDEFVSLLQRTIRAVAIARNFPPPDGHQSWGGSALRTAVNDFLASTQTPRRLTDLATHCRTDIALKRRLERTVRNFFADQGRRTPTGRLALRFNEVLGKHPDFERRGAYWAIVGGPDEPGHVDMDDLSRVLANVDVVVPKAWTTGDRQSPDVDASSVMRLSKAALEAAGGPLRPSVIAQAAALRLGVGGASLSLDATSFDAAQQPALSDEPASAAVIREIRAAEVFGLLNDHERVAIGLPAVPVAKLGPMLGVSGSKAALIRKRAVTILQNELGTEEDGQAVADALFDLARKWTESWTS